MLNSIVFSFIGNCHFIGRCFTVLLYMYRAYISTRGPQLAFFIVGTTKLGHFTFWDVPTLQSDMHVFKQVYVTVTVKQTTAFVIGLLAAQHTTCMHALFIFAMTTAYTLTYFIYLFIFHFDFHFACLIQAIKGNIFLEERNYTFLKAYVKKAYVKKYCIK